MEIPSKISGLAILMLSLLMFILCLTNACTDTEFPPAAELAMSATVPKIHPDYTDLTIPVNIASLHFQIEEEGETFKVFLEGSKGDRIQMKDRSGRFYVSPAKWKAFLRNNQGSAYKIKVFKKETGQWHEFAPIVNQISRDPIDPFLAYRLIPPGYETWSTMGLYQRDLTTFRERPIVENKHLEENCINCHSFAGGSSKNMMFHIRGSLGGTIIKTDTKIEKVNLKREETLSAGVYPSFHPSGAYIAYSTNKIEQYFHAHPERSIEVFDRHSDLILYHINSGEVTHVPGTRGDVYMETFPNWSPDGRYLYFSRSSAQADTPFDSIRYNIYRMAFDPDQAEFGPVEPVFVLTENTQSASFPRISPDGKYLLITVHNYGTFPIWHKEADLCLVNLNTGDIRYPGEINSDESDSFHSWSSNSRWIVFSSRRYDGLFTRIFLAYLDEDGNFHKPFLLPQKDPQFYDKLFFSYNVPELVKNKIELTPWDWANIAKH